MTPAGKMLTWLCLVFALCAKAAAITSDISSSSARDYEQIAIRNVFGLKPPPPPGPPPEANKTPPSKITLTGITTFGGKRAIMKIAGTPKVGQAAPEQTLVLRENQKEGEIEVVGIDETSGTVKVINGGVEQLLTFDKDGMKPSTAGTAPAPAAGAPHPGLPAPAPTATTSGFAPATGGFKPGQPFPPRPNRTDNSSHTGINPSATAAPAFGAAPAYTANAQPQDQQQPQMSYEQQLIMMEINREATKDKVLKGELPPIPFTELTPSDAVGARQNPAATATANPTAARGYPRLPQ